MNGISARPEMEFKVGAVRAAIWTNPRHNASGQVFNSHKVLLERTYKDGYGNFKTTSGLDINDIPKAILALKKAYNFLLTGQGRPAPASQEASALEAPVRIP